MNNFFNTTSQSTVTVNGNTLTALDIAKVIAFSKKYIQWDGSETWISNEGALNLVCIAVTNTQEETDNLFDSLKDKVTHFCPDNSEYAKNLRRLISEGLDIVYGWAKLKMYTCIPAVADQESRFINLDKLESMLGYELGDTVRERLSLVEVERHAEDNEWKFKGPQGTSWRNSATEGVLCEIRDAVNLIELLVDYCKTEIERGYRTVEDIAYKQPYALQLDFMTAGDIADLKSTLAEIKVKPVEFTVYVNKNGVASYFESAKSQPWDAAEELMTLPTMVEAMEFTHSFNASFALQRRRNHLAEEVAKTQERLEELRAALLAS